MGPNERKKTCQLEKRTVSDSQIWEQ
jgi:hypothetical protein